MYQDKKTQYDDNKSSSVAFLLVGSIVCVFAVLIWTGILNLPLYGFNGNMFKTVLTAMGIIFVGIGLSSAMKAKKMVSEVSEEENLFNNIIDWFKENITVEDIDSEVNQELNVGEKGLLRLEIIQDKLITNFDLTDQGMIDELAEKIYSILYEDSSTTYQEEVSDDFYVSNNDCEEAFNSDENDDTDDILTDTSDDDNNTSDDQ